MTERISTSFVRSSSTRCYRIDLPPCRKSNAASALRSLHFFLRTLVYTFFSQNAFRKTLILHGARSLNDEHRSYNFTTSCLASLRRERRRNKVFFSSSHVSLRQKPSPATWITILPSSFHLLRGLTIRLCTHASLRARQLTHAANHRALSSPLRVSPLSLSILLLQRASREWNHASPL